VNREPLEEWLARQLLPPRDGASIADVLRSAGWIHTAGGTGPYLSLKARIPKLTRQDVDDLTFRRFEIIEVVSVRGSTMLVPRDDVAVALAAGRRSFQEHLRKLSFEQGEIETLADRIVKVIGDGVRNPEGLREEIPPRFIRDLGAAGKKLGFASTLPIALRRLQLQGRLLRLGEDFRLDARRYFYRLWPDSIPIAAPPDDLDRALAERFLIWAAPATVDDFAWWAGIGKTAARKALSAGQSPPAVRHSSSSKGIFLLPFRDNYFGLHRGLSSFAGDSRIQLLDYSNKPAPLARLDSLHHNAIVVDGELRGIWEYDSAEEGIVWRVFHPTPGVEEAIARTESFIREELGDHKFYAFDHGRTRELRLAFIRR
jgi:winged helix DNA-binding protein